MLILLIVGQAAQLSEYSPKGHAAWLKRQYSQLPVLAHVSV